MFQLLAVTSSPIFQVAVVLVSATLVVASLALIVASRKVRLHHDTEACYPSSSSSLPHVAYTSQQSVAVKKMSSAAKTAVSSSPVFLDQSAGPFNQQRLMEMLKSKRVRLSPEVHSPRKFALVNLHIHNVFREHRRYTQLPTFSQAAAAATTTTPATTATFTRSWSSSLAYSGPVSRHGSSPLVAVACA